MGLGEDLRHVRVLETRDLARVEDGGGVTRPRLRGDSLTPAQPRIPSVRHHHLGITARTPLQTGVTLTALSMVKFVTKKTFLFVVSVA